MFEILVDGNTLYHPLAVDDGYAVNSASVDLEIDKTGSATISIPPTNPMYGRINKMKSIVRVLKDDEEIFRGYVLHDDRDFSNNKEIYCEGELAFLINHVLPPYKFENKTVKEAFKEYIKVYNNQSESNKQFTVGKVTVKGTVNISNPDYTPLYDEMVAQLVDNYGGHIRTRYDSKTKKRYIDYLSDYERVCSQSIEFGVNMLDFSEHVSAEDVFTVLVPLGKKIEDEDGNSKGRVDITSVNTDHKPELVSKEGKKIFGTIWKIQVWDDVEDPSELKQLGEEMLKHSISLATSISVSAVDLSIIDLAADSIQIGDGIRVISAPHGINEIFQCSHITYDLLNPENSSYEFGKTKDSISQEQVNTSNVAASAASSGGSSSEGVLAQCRVYTDNEILSVSNAYESTSSKVVGSSTDISDEYLKLLHNVEAKQYKTRNGEDRTKFGILGDDLYAGLNQLGLIDPNSKTTWPALSKYDDDYIVSYDELVALLWRKSRYDSLPYINPKSVAIFGASTCYGTIRSGVKSTILLQDMIHDHLGYEAVNYAVGGSGYTYRDPSTTFPSFNARIRKSFVDRPEGFGAYLIFGGTNDYGLHRTLGSFNDEPSIGADGYPEVNPGDTVYASIKAAIQYIYKKKPNSRVLVVTPMFRDYVSVPDGNGGNTYRMGNVYYDATCKNNAVIPYTGGDYCDAIIEVCNYYSVPVLDMRKECAVNILNASELMWTDSGLRHIHANEEGYLNVYSQIARWVGTKI